MISILGSLPCVLCQSVFLACMRWGRGLATALIAIVFCARSMGAEDTITPVVESIEEVLPFYDREAWQVRDPQQADTFPAMRVLLSRHRYWAQDGHLDVVVQLDPDVAGGDLGGTRIEGRLRGLGNRTGVVFTLESPSERFIFYPEYPLGLTEDGEGELELTWLSSGGQVLAQALKGFRVEEFAEPVPSSGVIPLFLPNETGAVEKSIPVTVGVPFARGILYDKSQLRLVSVDGGQRREIPMQVTERARWSKFGSLKWVHLNFTIDLPGTARELELEYGPTVGRSEREVLLVTTTEGFPMIKAGRLGFSDGLWFDVEADGSWVKVLDESALHRGAFVEREDGRVYRPSGESGYEIEEAGPEKVVLRRVGWYVDESSGDAFCRYVTRFSIHRDSTILRIFHTWIFTGDGNHERIADMGWEFPLAEGVEAGGFLISFDDPVWRRGDYLLQWDYEHFDVTDGTGTESYAGRAPGVAMARGNGIRLFFGAKDFWQNYPSELEFQGGSLWFHNWPKHNWPAGYSFEGELITSRSAPALASAARHEQYDEGRLTRSEWTLNLLQARFAHEGELLDFRLPDELVSETVVSEIRSGRPWRKYWREGEPESINAQGMSRTEEMWIYLTAEEEGASSSVRVMEGLDGAGLRGVVDPGWVAASGVFYEIHPQDWENFPEEEQAFEQLALAYARWQEQLGLYGMWIYGDITGWDLGLDRREPAFYRAFRKRHHGWPYSWVPYARSGDVRLLHTADAATRQNIDANWRHHASDVGPVGLLQRAPLPWVSSPRTTTRCYESKVDYLLHSWYLTGYPRAQDMLHDWMEQTRVEQPDTLRGPIGIPHRWGDSPDYRQPFQIWASYMQTYEATFDPWFLVAAHEIAKGFKRLFDEEGYKGHIYVTFRDFVRYTGDPEFEEYFLNYADHVGGHWDPVGWAAVGVPVIESNAHAWRLDEDDYRLRRLAHSVDWLKASVWDGKHPEYMRGLYARSSEHHAAIATGYLLRDFPLALAALHEAGYRPDPIPELFEIVGNPTVAFIKSANEPVPLRLRAMIRPDWHNPGEGTATYTVTTPAGLEILQGKWKTKEELNLEIPADAPSGVYRLTVSDVKRFLVPVVKPVDIPEVLIFEPGQEVVFGNRDNQLWFLVPEGVKHFQVEIPLGDSWMAASRSSIWSPDGERAWDLNYHRRTYTGGNPAKAMIEVPPGQDGKLWRITLPGPGTRFRMDPKIPPIYATDSLRWFDPR